MIKFKCATILYVKRNNEIVIGDDGQVTFGNII